MTEVIVQRHTCVIPEANRVSLATELWRFLDGESYYGGHHVILSDGRPNIIVDHDDGMDFLDTEAGQVLLMEAEADGEIIFSKGDDWWGYFFHRGSLDIKRGKLLEGLPPPVRATEPAPAKDDTGRLQRVVERAQAAPSAPTRRFGGLEPA